MVIALFCNFTIDIVCLNGIAKIQIGGPAYYASLALNFMGEKSTLYTAIGKGIQKKKVENVTENKHKFRKHSLHR